MPIVKKIEYKGQIIEIIFERSLRGGASHYRIKYFPKRHNSRCAWKMLQSLIEFINRDDAIRETKSRINTEFENGNWVCPTERILKGYEHEE